MQVEGSPEFVLATVANAIYQSLLVSLLVPKIQHCARAIDR